MQSKNIKENVSAEVTTTVEKIYVVKEPSFFDGLYYNSGEVIRTSKEPSIHMKEVSEEELKNKTSEKRVYAEDPSVEVERLRKQRDVAKQKQIMMF